MQVADRSITSTKRKLIMRDASQLDTGMVVSLESLNAIALRYQVPQNEVRGLLVACGYRVPEPVARQPEARPAAPLAAPPAAAKPPAAPPEVIAGILKGTIYRQLGEGDDAFIITTRAQFLKEREALLRIFKSGGLT
jgi:hypothetical protein